MRRHLTALSLGLALVLPALGQDDAVKTIPFEGVEVFCHILHHERIQPINKVGDLDDDPRQAVLIVFGSPQALDHIQAKRFVDQGGNILIATDQPWASAGLGVQISGVAIEQAKEERAYRGQTACPWLTYDDEARQHRLFRFLTKGIATNRPSDVMIGKATSSVQRLLPFPNGAGPIVDHKRFPTFHQKSIRRTPPFVYMAGAPANAKPDGRALFIAGQGLFMNGMMLQGDSDNFQFAINAVRWLREGPDGMQRTKALFIVDGRVVTNFDANLAAPAPIPTVKMFDRLLRGLEDERFFHRLFDTLFQGAREWLLRGLAGAATFLLCLYGLKKFMEGRYLLETAVPRMVGSGAALSPGVPRLEQRQDALFRQADLGPEARLLVRTWFRQEFGITPEQWTSAISMEFQAKRFFWGRAALQRQAEFLMKVARSAEPIPVTRREFARLFKAFPQLSLACRTGRAALLVSGKNVR